MTEGIWLFLCGGYLLAAWAAKKHSPADTLLCFFHGIYLAMLCFAALPFAMEGAFFYRTVIFSAAGVALGLLAEKKPKAAKAMDTALFIGLATALFLLQKRMLTGMEAALLALFSGMGLYHASSGILPEPVQIGKAFLSAGGFLLGVFLFSPFF